MNNVIDSIYENLRNYHVENGAKIDRIDRINNTCPEIFNNMIKIKQLTGNTHILMLHFLKSSDNY